MSETVSQMLVKCGVNKNLIISIVVVVLLGLGVWWLTSNTGPNDALAPTATPFPSVSISPSPSVSVSPVSASPAITITSPKANEAVDSPVTVSGKARVFENQFTVRVKDSAGKVVYERNAVMSDAKNSGVYGNYSVKVPFPIDSGSNFKIEVLSMSPKGDGSFEGYASVAIKLKTTEISDIYAAFITSDDCSTVTLYPRQIIKTPQFIYMSLVELLKGPTPEEKTQAAVNQIPAGVQINSFKQVGDTLYADFNQTLQQGVAGSCRVQAIRSQITNTLKQFFGINTVIISIDGRTDGILQP